MIYVLCRDPSGCCAEKTAGWKGRRRLVGGLQRESKQQDDGGCVPEV